MSVNFKSEDWEYVRVIVERTLENQRAILENPEKTYKEKLVANGQVLLAKTLLNLPQSLNILPLKGQNANRN